MYEDTAFYLVQQQQKRCCRQVLVFPALWGMPTVLTASGDIQSFVDTCRDVRAGEGAAQDQAKGKCFMLLHSQPCDTTPCWGQCSNFDSQNPNGFYCILVRGWEGQGITRARGRLSKAFVVLSLVSYSYSHTLVCPDPGSVSASPLAAGTLHLRNVLSGRTEKIILIQHKRRCEACRATWSDAFPF